MTSQQIIIASIVSNIVALVLLVVSWKKKNLARVLFAILFIWASWTNWKIAHNDPNDYLDYGKYAVSFYKTIIYGEFAKHITGYVSLIAIGQLLIGLGLLARGIVVKISCIGGIIFLLAIAPLGTGAAFPFSITAALALFFLYKYNFTKDILKNKWWV
jgi:heme O synthase-like polyprenyltransferase